MLLAAVLALSPLGREVIYLSFFSNEALSRSISQPIALTAIAIAALVVLLEWRLRVFMLNRGATTT
jgi:hypothetical protein